MIYKNIKKRKYKIKIRTVGLQKNFRKIFRKNKKGFLEVFSKKPWEKYIGKIHALGAEENQLSARMKKRKKKFSLLNKSFAQSKLSPFFFKPWIKGKKFFLNARQKHLKEIYRQENNRLALKERKDFFKTSFGEILKNAYLNSPDFKGLWVSARILLPYQLRKKNKKTKQKKK